MKCDGSRPCKKCRAAAVKCESDVSDNEPEDEADEEAGAAPNRDKEEDADDAGPSTVPGLPAPQSIVWTALPRARGGMGRTLVDFGFRESEVGAVAAFAPAKLQVALDLLLHLYHTSFPPRPLPPPLLLPPSLLPAFAPAAPAARRAVAALHPDGTAAAAAFSRPCAALLGMTPEELSLRAARADLPLFTTQYRFLCFALQNFLAVLRREPLHSVHIYKTTTGRAQRTAGFKFVRTVTQTVFQGNRPTHTVHDAWELTEEEFDRERRHPRGEGAAGGAGSVDFLRCNLKAAEISVAGPGLEERETIRAMLGSAEGRARLDRLADRVMRVFKLSKLH